MLNTHINGARLREVLRFESKSIVFGVTVSFFLEGNEETIEIRVFIYWENGKLVNFGDQRPLFRTLFLR